MHADGEPSAVPAEALHPTLDEALRGAIVTLRNVILPAIDDGWARATAVQLTGLLEYARRLAAGARNTSQLAEVQQGLAALLQDYPELRHVMPAGDAPDAAAVLEVASVLLVYAVDAETEAARAVRSRLRPLLIRQLNEEYEVTSIMLSTFRGVVAGDV